MKIWEEKTEQYTLEKTIEKRCGCIICALPIENNKILTSSITNNTIYMWSPNNNEGLSIEQSLTLHSDIVLSMIRLENGNLVSCGKDNNVIIWKKNEGGFYDRTDHPKAPDLLRCGAGRRLSLARGTGGKSCRCHRLGQK